MTQSAPCPRPARGGRIAVLAGTAEQYYNWCAQHDLNPRREAVYVHVARGLYDLRQGAQYAVVGTYEQDVPAHIRAEIRAHLLAIDAVCLGDWT